MYVCVCLRVVQADTQYVCFIVYFMFSCVFWFYVGNNSGTTILPATITTPTLTTTAVNGKEYYYCINTLLGSDEIIITHCSNYIQLVLVMCVKN